MTTHYRLLLTQPEARRLDIELEVDPRGQGSLDLVFPTWTPGSYLIREHQRHVDGLSAEQGGAALAVAKVDKATWRVSCPAKGTVRIRYRLACVELTVRTNHVDPTHAFVNPAAALPVVAGREAEPCELSVQAPAGFRTWVALPEREGRYQATDYDELADSPVEIGAPGAHRTHSFEAAGVSHELVVWGKGELDLAKLCADIARIVEVQAGWFGGLPDFGGRYLFLLHLNDKLRGGLEHRRSCALVFPRFALAQKAGVEDFLELVAHEYFHLWNVKRVRPAAFTPYAWTRENPTSLLWAMEGLTSTYEVMALRRAGLIEPERFLSIWAERLTALQRTPGRLRMSLLQASQDAWIKHYRPDETTANTAVSYYLKGSVVGFLLDLELRRLTLGKRSLDDVMRLLFERHGRPPGLPEDGVERAVLEVAGPSHAQELKAWFDLTLRSTQELPVQQALSAAGLTFGLRAAEGPEDKGGVGEPAKPSREPRSWLGAALRDKGSGLEVASVVEGGPAQRAGLASGDEIVALAGFRGELRSRLVRAPAGQPLRLSVFRLEELLEVTAVPAEPPLDTAWIGEDPRATAEQLALRKAWLGAAWTASRIAAAGTSG